MVNFSMPFRTPNTTSRALSSMNTVCQRSGFQVDDMNAPKMAECSVLLTADVENEVQPKLAELYDLKADILKYPHHGTVILHNDFLRDVDPEYVVFTHGTKNTLDAQRQLVRFGYDRMAFATWGLITLQTDGHKWIVRQDVAPDLAEYAKKYKPGE